MKRSILTLVTVFSMCCLIACSGEKTNDANAGGTGGNESVVTEAPADEPAVTPAPAEETPEPTVEPTPEPTPEPTENPYPGIDFDSELPGLEWVESFTGIIEEPKFVVYSDITGRKEIIENEEIVFINPDEDIIAVFSPDGYLKVGDLVGIKVEEFVLSEHVRACVLNPERTRKNKFEIAETNVKHNGENVNIWFTIQSQE